MQIRAQRQHVTEYEQQEITSRKMIKICFKKKLNKQK